LSVGALILGAIACSPGLAFATLASVALTAAGTLLLGLGSAAVRSGSVGCIAVLTTLAITMFSPDGSSPAVVVLASSLLAVLFSASFQAIFANVALPTHALPFIAATWAIHLASRTVPSSGALANLMQPLAWIPGELWQSSWLDGPAAIVFMHGMLPGLFIMLAILVHSRIGFLLALVGAAVSLGMRAWLRAGQPWGVMDTTAFFNAVLTAMAIGGVWFVPQPSSVALAAASSGLAVFLAFAFFPVLGLFSLPVISLPFVVAVLVVLTAARMRQQDRWPRSTIPAERPEEALARHLVRVRRFGNLAWLPFRLPFRGEWFVSQGHDGEHTHKGLWRHGLDFEGRTPEGKANKDHGKDLRDYVCYGLPVVAAGAGTVALIEDGIPDNRPGELNTRDNWGNAVVIRHGEGLFSVSAHLQPKSLRVKVGDVVTPGMEIGRCGNSGRSSIPHLHFQIQRAKVLGSPTLAFDFGDVVQRKDDGFRLWNHTVPKEGDLVRPAQRDDELARVMSWAPGTTFELAEPATGKVERARVEIDLYGTRSLRSSEGRLTFDAYDNGLVLADYGGASESLLRYLLLAWARLPFDLSANLHWTDALSRRLFVPSWLRFLADLWVVVVPEFGKLEVAYSMRREEGRVLIEGKAETWQARSRLSLSGDAHSI
jgi:murein DD-endopeptidase MepM/ murein hydrolase activator NlpD